jgi:dihydropyrimidine dehydrogenase (NAD+) subunit PreA
MPAYAREVEAALAEGVEFLFSVVPEAILGEGRVAAIRLRRVRWDAPGRAAQRFETRGGPFDLETDSVVPAVGLAALPGATFGLETAPGGWIRTDPETGATSREGVFAGGDVATGPATAVAAVGQGRRAAAAIDAWLTGGARSGGSGQGRGGGRTDAEAPGRPPAMAGATGTASTSTSTSTSTSRVGGEGEIYEKPRADLSVTFCGVRFVNPFVLAAAPPTDDLDMVRAGFRAGWAGAVLKTTSVEGTPVPLAYPMMSSLEVDGRRVVGLGNIDLISEHHIDVVERRVATLKNEFPDRVVIASIMGAKKEDWQTLVRRLEAVGVDLIECSFSCPQGTLGNRPGAMLGQDAEASRTVAGWVKEAARRVPVVIKLTPQVADVVDVARAVLDAGADGICASNTIPSLMGIDLASFVPYPQVGGKSTYSGMSGPAIKPITLRCIAEIARRTGAQITGTGGPVAWSDAVELMLVGARTVQFCTAVMHHGFDIVDDLAEGLGDYLDRLGLARAGDLVGRTLPHIVGHDELPRGAKIRSRISPDLCVRCGVCVTACRDGGHRALTAAEDRAPRVDDLRCLGCGLCRLVCPVPGCVRVEVAG